MIHEIDLELFTSLWADGGCVIDVREPGEYAGGHVPGARLMPLGAVPTQLGELPTDRPVYVICASGNRSQTAVQWMQAAGIDAYSVVGGTSGWILGGRPLVIGLQENAA